MDQQGSIHSEHPFAPPVERRDPARRFRGRLASPVTVWTAGEAGAPGGRAGLTISSLLVAEGEPPRVLALISDLTDLWVAIKDSGAFVVHVLSGAQQDLSERFALRRPAPGGLFAGLEVSPSTWGPVLEGVPNRAYCRLEATAPAGYQQLVTGMVEDLDIEEGFDQPLLYFRGRYLTP